MSYESCNNKFVILQDLAAAVRRVSAFFNKQFTDEQLLRLCDHLSIENFKNNKSLNYDVMKELGLLTQETFIRKGNLFSSLNPTIINK